MDRNEKVLGIIIVSALVVLGVIFFKNDYSFSKIEKGLQKSVSTVQTAKSNLISETFTKVTDSVVSELPAVEGILRTGQISKAIPIKKRCLGKVCKNHYFTGDYTGFSWSAKRKGIFSPFYTSFRNSNRTVVLQIDQILSDRSVTFKGYDVNFDRSVERNLVGNSFGKITTDQIVVVD